MPSPKKYSYSTGPNKRGLNRQGFKLIPGKNKRGVEIDRGEGQIKSTCFEERFQKIDKFLL